jgi:hypothetical protein
VSHTAYTIGWIGWLLAFLCLEIPALLNHRNGDTFSDHVWKWFRVGDGRHGPVTWLLRGVLLVFMSMLWLHFNFRVPLWP